MTSGGKRRSVLAPETAVRLGSCHGHEAASVVSRCTPDQKARLSSECSCSRSSSLRLENCLRCRALTSSVGVFEHRPAASSGPDAHHPAISLRSRALQQAGCHESGDEPTDVRRVGHEPVRDRTQGDALRVPVEAGDPHDRVLGRGQPVGPAHVLELASKRWLSNSTRRYVSRPTQSRRGSPPLIPLAPAPARGRHAAP